MQLVYWSSSTGHTARLLAPLGGIPLHLYDGEQDVLLAFPSYEQPRLGLYIPKAVRGFVRAHSARIRGIVGVGSITFGPDYCRGAEQAAKHLRVPLVTRIDQWVTDENKTSINNFLGGR